ncbi:response regulator transcription factor [Puniceicoccaceae bacterium]|nr:response regulator transcription factor [Puniceicoccaceae bacterium]
MKDTISITIIEDHIAYRNVIKRSLEKVPNMEVISRYGTAEIALRDFENRKVSKNPDIILLDLNLPGMSGLEAIPWIRDYLPKAKIIILSQSDNESDVVDAISKGATGYLLKSAKASEIIAAIQTVIDGGASLDSGVASYIIDRIKKDKKQTTITNPLSDRELAVLKLLAEGMLKKEISEELKVSVPTVAFHVKNIFQKLEASNAPAAVGKAYKKGIL